MNEQPVLRRRRNATTGDIAAYEASSTYRRARLREDRRIFAALCFAMFVFGIVSAALIALAPVRS